jgi:hypothetical protein
MEFHENLSRESGVVPCGRTDGLIETDMTKLIVASQVCERAETLHGVVSFVTQSIQL